MTKHVQHLINFRFYFDPNITQKEIKHLTSQISKHQGSVSNSSSSSSVTHFIVVSEAKKKQKGTTASKEKKILHSKHLIELGLSRGLTVFTVEELESVFEECSYCKEEKYNQIKSQLILEKKTGKMIKLPFLLISDVSEMYNPLMKVYKGVSEIPKINFEAPLGYCAIQSTHNNSTKNEYRYCECCKDKFLDQTKHFYSKKHLSFAQQQENYKEIDMFMKYFNEKEEEKEKKKIAEENAMELELYLSQQSPLELSQNDIQEKQVDLKKLKREPHVLVDPKFKEECYEDNSEIYKEIEEEIEEVVKENKQKKKLTQTKLVYDEEGHKLKYKNDKRKIHPSSPCPIRSRKKKKKVTIIQIDQ
eukprot:gene2237-2411_t